LGTFLPLALHCARSQTVRCLASALQIRATLLMMGRGPHVVTLAAIALTFGASGALAQGTMRRGVPETETTDSSGHIKTGVSPLRARLSGTVVLADGSVAEELVDIYAECAGNRVLVATADSKGRFSVSRDSLRGMTGTGACALRAFLEGHRSEAKPLADLKPGTDERVGRLVLQPLSANANGLTSSADEQASKAQQKIYEKALDQAARTEWPSAIDSLRKVTSAYPGYSSAWLTLGLLQLGGGDRRGAQESFLSAVRTDPKFGLPLIQAATLDASQGNWSAVRDRSQKAIDLNPAAFPDAWALNALGNLGLEDIEAAEKSAREGLRVDTGHDYPELEYALGSVLASKQQVGEAIKHLQAYIDRAPHGMYADAARSTLAQMRAPAAAVPASSAFVSAPAAQASDLSTSLGDGPPTSALRDRNAPLLLKTPDYTCLESITRTRVDARGRARDADLFRVEIGISDEREIYGYAGGKRFSGESLAAMLGNSFSTTGVFSMLARALIAGNGTTIAFAGLEVLDGETVYRYYFRSIPGEARWSIQYGKSSARGGEEGYFFVGRASLTLRRVQVRAIQIPTDLKLKELDAVIDYQPETVGTRPVLLPYEARVHVEEGSGVQSVSRMFFDHCRSFTAESTFFFGADNSQDESTHPVKSPELPPDLEIAVSLGSPVSVTTTTESDLLTARVAAPVALRGHEIIAAGAAVEGHVRPWRGENGVIVELDRVQTRHGWAPFYARLVSVASTQAQVESSAGSRKKSDPEIPGVAKIVFATRSAELAVGTRMLWRTEPLAVTPNSVQPQLGTEVGIH
jgi:tetratricopeptide (TPR) repeat protein